MRLVPIAKTEDLASYFGELCQGCIQEKIKHLTIILDNNSTHKDKLRRYLIHLLRLRLLHHLPSGISIEQVEMRLSTFFETQQLQTPIQILNTIQHIYNLIL